MNNLTIEKYGYKAGCDLHGCRNTAEHSIGSEVVGPGLKLNICNECLQQIINTVPLDMIMNRPDIQEMLTQDEEELTMTNDDVGKVREVEAADLSLMKFNELKELAAQKNITVPFGCSKEQLIQILEGK